MSGYSFCIITDGKEPEKTLEEIQSIRALNLMRYDIVLVGATAEIVKAADLNMLNWMLAGVRWNVIYAGDLAEAGRLGALRNLACDHARFGRIVLADDDICFDPYFGWGLEAAGDEWDVMAAKILNPDGSRYWDWKTHRDGANHLLDYNVSWHPDLSLTGGLMVLKRETAQQVKWNDGKGFYQGEDVEFSQALKKAGMRIVLNLRCQATHMANYTQRGDVVVRI